MGKYEDVLFFLLCGLVFLTPLTIFPYSADIFELPKVTLLRLWVLVVIGIFSAKVYKTGKLTLRRTRLDVPVIFFALIAFLATLFSVNPVLSLAGSYYRYEGLFTLLAYIAIFFGATQFHLLERRHILLYVILASASLNALYGVFQHYGYDFIKLTGTVFELTRSSGALGNPVFLGALLVTTISLPLAKFFQEKGYAGRLIFCLLFSLLALSTLLTSTRAAWLGLGALLAVLALLLPQRITLRRLVLVGLLVLVALAGIFLLSKLYSPSGSTLAQRVFSVFQAQGSAATRLDMWKGSLKLIRDRPVLGSGWETFEGTFPRYGTKFLMTQEELPDRPHNQLLYVTTSAGLLGLLAYLWLAASSYGLAVRSLLSSKLNSSARTWLAALVAGLTAYFVQEQFSISSAGVTPIFWLFLGVLARESSADEHLLSRQVSLTGRSLMVLAIALLFLVGSIVNLQFLWADVLYRRGIESQSAGDPATFLRRAVELNPYVNKYRSALARVYTEEAYRRQNIQLLEEAIAVCEEGLQIDPRDEALWIQAGDLYLAKQDRESALQAYKRVLDLHPLSAGARWALGDLYLAGGDTSIAVRELEVASSLAPKHIGILASLGDAYWKQGRTGQAKQTYLKILEFEPENEKASSALKSLEGDR